MKKIIIPLLAVIFLIGCTTPPQKVEPSKQQTHLNPHQWYNLAIFLGDIKYKPEIEEAIKRVNKALELDPINTDAWLGKAILLGYLNKFNESIQAYDKVLELDPQNITAWSGKGFILTESGKHDEAIRMYDKVIERYPNSIDALGCRYAKTHIFSFKKDRVKTLGELEKVISKDDIYIKMAREDEAFKWLWDDEEFKKLTELTKEESSNVWLDKGQWLLAQAKYDEAIRTYDKSIEFNPENPHPWFFKSCAYSGKKDRENALDNLFIAINLNREYQEIAKKSEIFQWLRSDKEFKKIIEIKTAIEWFQEGLGLFSHGKYDQSIPAFDKAIELNPKYTTAWYKKGIALCISDKFDEAIKALNKVIELDPRNVRTYYDRAWVHSRKGDKKNAINDLTSAINLHVYYKEKAKDDKDFQWLWEDEEFKKITK